jgi:hypothetical protein
MTDERCPCCGVLPGEWHLRGCEVEQCPYCGGQALRCDSPDDPIPLDDRLRWTGQWPGEAEAIQFGWFCKRGRSGWKPCRKYDPEAVPDLNRVRREAVWDRDEKRYTKPINRRRVE